jgi:hypothetical protein
LAGFCSLKCAYYPIGTNMTRTKSTLSLFVFRILTDNSDASFSLDDFAFFANRFN